VRLTLQSTSTISRIMTTPLYLVPSMPEKRGLWWPVVEDRRGKKYK
jgi:hypothetical protein